MQAGGANCGVSEDKGAYTRGPPVPFERAAGYCADDVPGEHRARSEEPPGHPRLSMSQENELLGEQIAYYRAVAGEYEDHALDAPGGDALFAALDSFRPTGSVLELACGTGLWTQTLLGHADDVTALDAAPEMLAIASARLRDERVRFVETDLFSWKPARRYDVVFFAFWLSHVPVERFDWFWSLVDDSLLPGGRVFFIDDGYRTPDELIEGESSSTVRRRLNDGTAHRAVKVAHEPIDLEARLASLGWRITVTPTSGPFFWGAGGRLSDLPARP
jgi:SAM-dependent methyltransferase